ncbi:MAG TPA: selenide, water dikinase SelD [Candidatus Obscuribacterales bacterium]
MSDGLPPTSRKLTANIKAAGCAAKIGSAELKRALSSLPRITMPELIAGIDNFEDAAVYKLSEELAIIQTIDFFPPVVDDPQLFGRIAATNALSDVYAMGGKPILALNVLCFPTCDYPTEVVEEILRGGAQAVTEAGAVIAGGHSIQGPEPIYGLSVMGLVKPAQVLTNGGAKEGDSLVLTKPIGTGVGLLGLKADLLSESAKDELITSLTRLNAKTLEIARQFSLNAATDVTGFGLAGHLVEMAKASNLGVYLYIDRVPLLPETFSLAQQGFVPAGAYGNRKSFESQIVLPPDLDLAFSDLLFDPQTSGGLLFSLNAADAGALVQDLNDAGIKAKEIGTFHKDAPGIVEVKA